MAHIPTFYPVPQFIATRKKSLKRFTAQRSGIVCIYAMPSGICGATCVQHFDRWTEVIACQGRSTTPASRGPPSNIYNVNEHLTYVYIQYTRSAQLTKKTQYYYSLSLWARLLASNVIIAGGAATGSDNAIYLNAGQVTVEFEISLYTHAHAPNTYIMYVFCI